VKPRTGYVYKDKATGNWYARIGYTKNNGKRSSIKRKVSSKIQGKQVLKDLIVTFEEGGRKALDIERLTFIDLCNYYSEHYVLPAQYSSGRKVGGLRSVSTVKGYVKVLRQHFGSQVLKSITYDDIRSFRSLRLKTETHQSKQRSLTTVNREMAYLRRMLNIAERNGWISRNPFKLGDALIHAANELLIVNAIVDVAPKSGRFGVKIDLAVVNLPPHHILFWDMRWEPFTLPANG
jgi:hypothetical protein